MFNSDDNCVCGKSEKAFIEKTKQNEELTAIRIEAYQKREESSIELCDNFRKNIRLLEENEQILVEKLAFENKEKLASFLELENLKLDKMNFQQRVAASIDNWKKKLAVSETNSRKQVVDLQIIIEKEKSEKEILKKNLDSNLKETYLIQKLLSEEKSKSNILSQELNDSRKEIATCSKMVDKLKAEATDFEKKAGEIILYLKISHKEIVTKKDDELKTFKVNEIRSRSELDKLSKSLESSDELIAELTAQLVLLEDEIKQNKNHILRLDTLKVQLETTRQDLLNEKKINANLTLENNHAYQNINDLKVDIKEFRDNALILEQKVDNMQTIAKLQSGKSCEIIQRITNELEISKHMITVESEKVNKLETGQLSDKLQNEIATLNKKLEEERSFNQDTIDNLKEKIRLKNELLEKHWPSRVATLNHIINIKCELLQSSAASSDLRDEVQIMQLSEPNKNKFLELLEKLAETEDFNKSLTTILEAKEDEIRTKDSELNHLKSHTSCPMKGFVIQTSDSSNPNQIQDNNSIHSESNIDREDIETIIDKAKSNGQSKDFDDQVVESNKEVEPFLHQSKDNQGEVILAVQEDALYYAQNVAELYGQGDCQSEYESQTQSGIREVDIMDSEDDHSEEEWESGYIYNNEEETDTSDQGNY